MDGIFWRYHPDLNWGIEVLQTSALPLGYGTKLFTANPMNIPFI